MNKGESCGVIGEVVSVNGDFVIVETTPPQACVGCGAKSLCGTSKINKLKVKVSGAKVGDRVELVTDKRKLFKIGILIFIVGLIPAFILAVVSVKVLNSEIIAAISFLIATLGWLFLASKYINKITDVNITARLLDS